MKLTDGFVLFWGDDDIYSNFYLRPFEHNGRTWQCSEQAFMASKAEMFGDYETHKLIVEMDPSAKQFAFSCKKLGRLVKNYDDALWSQVRQVKMFEILLSKFSDPDMMQQILATGDRMIVEASPFDKIWGIGFDENNALSAPFSKWGQNLLGQELMKVRTIFTRMQK
jgi:ribA/ribD-fused uncharacterized protein